MNPNDQIDRVKNLQAHGLMLPHDLQLTNEYQYSRKHIDGYLRKAITDNPEVVVRIKHGVQLLTAWMAASYYQSKNERLAQLKNLNLEELVLSIFVGIAYCQEPELFVSVTSQLAMRLGFDDKKDSIATMAEMVAVLCNTDAFDIVQTSVGGSLVIQSKIPLPAALIDAALRSEYLPPMVCMPEEVVSNFESAYLTHNDSLILGKNNDHNGDLCLDVINTQNKVALKLNVEFLLTVPELPSHDLDTLEKIAQWDQFTQASNEMYRLMIRQGNQFWLTNRVDSRGRMYAQGYHITTQGTPYKKAMLELAEGEVVTGVLANW